MIFVTVGTHEQPFDRLVRYIDELKRDKVIEENVVIQSGFCTYEPQYCQWKKLFPYEEMLELVSNARIVITHGGPSSFIMPLQIGKTPIVVPRQYKYNEHVNDHQLAFSVNVANRMNNIIVVKEIDELKKIILNYDSIIENSTHNFTNNNKMFNMKLMSIIKDLMN